MKTNAARVAVQRVALGYLVFVLVARAVGQASKLQV